jgi:carboxypeptidase family protein/TonB-dependent receptor-like protein
MTKKVSHAIHRILAPGVIAALAIWLFAAPAAHGQNSTTAALIGTVRDASGAIVRGATVSLRQLASNRTYSATSDADGVYHFTNLPVGDYEVHVEAKDFAPYLNARIELPLGRATTLDITLRPAGAQEEVTVTDRPAAIDTTATGSTTSIDPERIQELPVRSRNYLEFTLLAPSVAPSAGQTTGGGGAAQGGPMADSGFSFGGLRPRSNAISIDGLDNTDETTGASRVALSPEIVREFQIVNNGISAEFGGAAGGAINVVTRTGANDIHGSAFGFLQNERFNGRDPISDGAREDTPRFRHYQFGASLGGPLIRDRLFYYAALEQENLSAEQEQEIDSLIHSRINTALASGTAPGLTVRSLASDAFSVGQDETQAAGKLTYLAGERHTLNFRLAFTNNLARNGAFNMDALSDLSARGSAYVKDYQLTASAVSTLSSSLINDLRFQSSARRVVTRAGATDGPGIEIAGLARFGRPYDADTSRRETREQFVDNVSLVRPRYEWKTGITLNHVSLRNNAREGFGGLFIFRTPDDFLAGRPAVWRQAFGESQTRFGVTSFGAFLQNQWRATQQLTLNLGARYDVTRLPAPFSADRNNFSPRAGLAYSPSNKWVARAGLGLYYDRLPLAYLKRAIQKDGVRAFEQVATDAEAGRVFALTGGGRALAPVGGISPSIFRADPEFQTPHSLQANAGLERLLSENITASAEYLFTRGGRLPRTRNINLLPPTLLTPVGAAALGIPSPTPQQLGRPVFGPGRIDPRLDAVYQLENSARSTYNGFTLSINKRYSNDSALLASYTVSRATDDASDFDEQPANPYDLRAERALSRHHVGQRFVLSALFEIGEEEEEKDKAAQGGGKEDEGLLRELLRNIEAAPIVTISSGRPVNALTGADESLSRAFPLAARPLGLARDTLRTPAFLSVDFRVVKYISLGGFTPYSASGTRRLDFVVEFFNLFNHPNAVSLNPFYGSGATPLSTFGAPTAFAAPRQVRFSIDFEF